MNFRHNPKMAIINSPEALKKLGLTKEEVLAMPDNQLIKLVEKIQGEDK